MCWIRGLGARSDAAECGECRNQPWPSLYSSTALRLYLWLQTQETIMIPSLGFAWPLIICANVFPPVPQLNNKYRGKRGKKRSLCLECSADLSRSAHPLSRALLCAGKDFASNAWCILTAPFKVSTQYHSLHLIKWVTEKLLAI